jgi:hypothetical protein
MEIRVSRLSEFDRSDVKTPSQPLLIAVME